MDDDDNVVPLNLAREPSWLRRLQRNKDGAPLPTLANALIILSNDPKFTGMIAHNEFTSQHLLMFPVPVSQDGDETLPGPYPRGWGAEDISLIQAYMQRVWSERFRRLDIESAVQAHAATRRFHPILEWVNSLAWDGISRIDKWIVSVFNPVSDTPMEKAYHKYVGSRFLIAAIRRLRQPGCKFDYMPIFEGDQGIGKSTAIRKLFGDEYFSDVIPPDLSSKDTAMSLSGIWCLEFAEIEHLIRSDPEVIKAFFSRQVDRFRPPYARDFVYRPRQGIFAGTTNNDDYLRDASGNRRFWPVKCRAADWAWIEVNRDQLWAEAAIREAAGESIWIEDKDVQSQAAAEADNRMSEEVWYPAINEWLLGHNEVQAADILEHALGMPKEKMTKAAAMRVANVLRTLGWKRAVVKVPDDHALSVKEKSKRVWRKPDASQDLDKPSDGTDIPFS